ncbi:endonuclease III [Candidatus Peregrinibacteria bacterium]|nr:endonuclease III [Candidatus Peregrinibacteria bacterium]
MPQLTLAHVLRQLKKLHHPPKTFLDFQTSLQLLVAVILSAQCTDARVNIVTKTLFKRCRTVRDFAEISQNELEKLVHSCGTYRMKAKNIRAMAALLIERHRGNVPQTMEELTALPGVGKKTAAVVLSAAFDINAFIAVDTHVMRVARRMGLSRQHDPSKIALDLMEEAPRKEWRKVTSLLISHGRAVCTARNRACDRCVFREDCPSSWVKGRKDRR